MTSEFKPRRAFDTPDLGGDQPLQWLSRGWSDFRANMPISLAYGAIFTVVSVLLVFGLYRIGLAWAILPACAGFTIVGPLMAMGLYEVSRRRAAGEPVTLKDALFVKTREPVQVAFMAVILMFGFLVWIRIAMIIFVLFFGAKPFPGVWETFALLLTPDGLGMLFVGSLFGAVFAGVAFLITAFSLPAFLVEQTDAVTAGIRSGAVVHYNLGVAIRWGAVVVAGVAFGIATFFIGFVVIFPLLGHATWHAYRDTLAKQTVKRPTDQAAVSG